jgi:hypothetical protein
VDGVGQAFTVNAAVDALHTATPGRKRSAEELSALDVDAEALGGEMARIVRQRRGVSVLDAVHDGDVEAVLEGLENGGDVNERVGGVGSLLHVAVDQDDLAMVRALLA